MAKGCPIGEVVVIGYLAALGTPYVHHMYIVTRQGTGGYRSILWRPCTRELYEILNEHTPVAN